VLAAGLSSRVISKNGEWFFLASEGSVGPFQSRVATISAVANFLELASSNNYATQLDFLANCVQKSPGNLFDWGRSTGDDRMGKAIAVGTLQISRTGENDEPPPRTDRFFKVKDRWYFSKRGGGTSGPFENLHDAEAELGGMLGRTKIDAWDSYTFD